MNRGELQRVECPWLPEEEGDGLPAEFYFYTELTFEEWARINDYARPDGTVDARFAPTLISLACRDANGRLLFGGRAMVERIRTKWNARTVRALTRALAPLMDSVAQATRDESALDLEDDEDDAPKLQPVAG